MKAVVTRVKSASVAVEDQVIGSIGQGYLVLLGIGPDDTEKDAQVLVEKIYNCRIFSDEQGKMNLNLASVQGSVLVVSQFTLYADLKSRRPSFSKAAKPAMANELYECFLQLCQEREAPVAHGEFGADMQVYSQNDGPVTLLFDSLDFISNNS